MERRGKGDLVDVGPGEKKSNQVAKPKKKMFPRPAKNGHGKRVKNEVRAQGWGNRAKNTDDPTF